MCTLKKLSAGVHNARKTPKILLKYQFIIGKSQDNRGKESILTLLVLLKDQCGSLIVVDAHTKWPEVILMSTMTASKTIAVLRSLFARYGICHQIVSDNGPQFTSEEYSQFCTGNGIRLTLLALYHPSSN